MEVSCPKCGDSDIFVKPNVPDAWCGGCGGSFDPCPCTNGRGSPGCRACGADNPCRCAGRKCVYFGIPMRL